MSTADTSLEAFESVRPLISGMKVGIFNVIQGADAGMTCEEVEDRLHIKHQTVSARIRDLLNDGWIAPSGARRLTRSGRAARVYVVVS